MNFTYSLISDMHVNHPQPKTPYDLLEQNVIVAGDTANGLDGLKFLEKLRNKGFTVFAVDGNHEHYSNVTMNRTPRETTDRFIVDNPRVTDVDDVLSVVCINGWYPVADRYDWYGWMNDGRYIHGPDKILAQHAANLLAVDDFEFLKDTIGANPERKYVVVTHTAPCEETLNPQFKGHYSNEWYWNPRMKEIIETYSRQILIWNHGHTHAPAEAVINGVRVVCNPRGYPGENPDWKPKSITVEY